MVSNRDFLVQIFGDDAEASWVCAVYGDPGQNRAWAGGVPSKYLPACLDTTNNYFSIATIGGDGKRTNPNALNVFALVLDDIGTKGDPAKALDLLGAPTWRVETSPGNEQWGYRYDKPLGPGEFALHGALVSRAASLGLADRLKDVVRLVRLPSGINGKPQHNGFRVRLVEFEPDRVFSPMDLGLALDVGADDIDASRVDTSALGACADLRKPDQWMKALDRLGMLKGEGSGPGKVEVTCPWESEHTVRSDTGTTYLGDGRFKCQHGHCAERKSPEFQQEIVRLLGEDSAGLASGEAVLAQIVLADFPLTAADLAVMASLAPEVGTVKSVDEALDRFVFVVAIDGFVDLETLRVLSRRQVDASLRLVVPPGRSGIAAGHNVLLADPRLRVVDILTFRPGRPIFTTELDLSGGVGARVSALNRWRPADVAAEPAGKYLPLILGHIAHIVPDDEDRDVLLNWMAHNVQKPGVKIPWAILIQGSQGTGKDMMMTAFKNAIGAHNCRDVTTAELLSDFNPWIATQIVVMQELSGTERFDLYNKLKPWIAAPPATVTVNQKFQPAIELPNIQNWIGFSNKDGAIAISEDDRRFWVYRSKAQKKSPDYYAELGEAIVLGAGEFLGWLLDRDISGWASNVCPSTANSAEAKAMMTREAQSGAVQAVIAELEEGIFAGRKMVSSLEISRAFSKLPGYSDRVLSDAMRVVGGRRWQDGRRLRLSNGDLCRLWVTERPDLYEQMTPDQAKVALEKEIAGAHFDDISEAV